MCRRRGERGSPGGWAPAREWPPPLALAATSQQGACSPDFGPEQLWSGALSGRQGPVTSIAVLGAALRGWDLHSGSEASQSRGSHERCLRSAEVLAASAFNPPGSGPEGEAPAPQRGSLGVTVSWLGGRERLREHQEQLGGRASPGALVPPGWGVSPRFPQSVRCFHTAEDTAGADRSPPGGRAGTTAEARHRV